MGGAKVTRVFSCTVLCFLISFAKADDSAVLTSEDIHLQNKKNIKIYVAGEVKTPKTLIVPRASTIGFAVNKSGGVSKNGNHTKVILMRRGKKWVYDLRKEDHKKIKLEPFDLVFVPHKIIIGK